MADIRKPLVKNLNTARQSNFGLLLMIGLLVYSPAQAQALDSAAIQKRALQGTWAAEHPEFGNWSWNKDKTVYFRIGWYLSSTYFTGVYHIGDV
jgi:hypothetical protein